jgi:S-adenosylmethionine-diacylglycerol 3-amino-3-carboxypropyl transferase
MIDGRMQRWWFDAIHRHNLVYNACWEDPRLDRQALRLGPADTVLVITSAGCNALDYALEGPRHVYAVDVNPWQNALLELKQAVIRRFDWDSAFAMFGRGSLPGVSARYRAELRSDLSPAARDLWDRRIDLFERAGRWGSFYFRGTSGLVARMANAYVDHVARARDAVEEALAAPDLDRQRAVYERRLRHAIWTPLFRWAVDRDVTMSLVGVPQAQRRQLDAESPGGLPGFIEAAVEAVFTRLPLADNYFWRVYLTGRYTPDCCPAYLTPEGFARLKAGLVDRVSVHTATVTAHLRRTDATVSRFVLLDHMDWFTGADDPALVAEWEAILDRAAPGAVVLWRSAGFGSGFVLDVTVRRQNQRRCGLGDLMRLRTAEAAALHARDRVHTYGSFHIADLATTPA